MKLRRLIIRWLFKYPVPEYYHAIAYYDNIEWDGVAVTKSCTAIKHSYKQVGVYQFRMEQYDITNGERWWVFAGPENQFKTVRNYAEMIRNLDQILRYGVIK